MPQEHVLFIGNPGTGKSTLLNALIGQLEFKSGVSFGSGLTYSFAKVTHNGVVFCDTPGLEDVEIRQRAAEEITKALKQAGSYRVFFVLTCESGRVRPPDVALIDTVRDALEGAVDSSFQHSVIVNKVSKKLMQKVLGNPAEWAAFLDAINSGAASCCHWQLCTEPHGST